MSYNPTISLPTEQFYFFSPDSSTPWRTCCEDCHALHDILLLRTSAIRRRLYLGRRLDSHQDEFVLLATYRGGSLISFQDLSVINNRPFPCKVPEPVPWVLPPCDPWHPEYVSYPPVPCVLRQPQAKCRLKSAPYAAKSLSHEK